MARYVMLGDGSGIHRPGYPIGWVHWINVLLSHEPDRRRYSDLRKCVDGVWYHGNVVLTLTKEDKEYISAHIPKRGNP